MKRLLVGLGIVVVTVAGLGGDMRSPAPPRFGLIANHAGERRVPPGHPVVDGQMPFWENMPYSMARGGNGRPVPHAVISYLPVLAATLEIAHRLPDSQPFAT